ncbi:MAG: fatty acid hydroxylase family protein [Burkholderiales bacterium]|nr:MAG: fatty acid hydroxylase family protein [Burkholderiales bacterium]
MLESSFTPRSRAQQAVSCLFLPSIVLLNLSAFALAYSQAASLELIVTLGSVFTLAAAWFLQRWLPLQATWNAPHADTRTDLVSMAVLLGAVDPVLKALGIAVAVWCVSQAPAWSSLFPSDLPFAAQVLLAVLLLELGKYAAHRLHHALPALWWLHAMHHSPKRFSAINNFRFHPLNYTINFSMSVLPMLLIGIPADVMWAYLAITQPVLMIQHANLDLRNPWLDKLFATPRSHLWHHDADERAGQLNFGSALLIWDHVFGTFRKVADGQMQPERIGLYAGSAYPAQASYLAQLLSMLKPPCCRRAGA